MFAGEADAYFKMFPNQKITEGRYPAAGTNEILVDERLKKNFYEYYKSEMELNQTIYISGVSMQTLIREAKIVGFYKQPDENSAMYSIVYADPSLARAFADLTYGANFVQELPDEIDFSISDASEDDLFGNDDDLFADSTFDDSFISSSDVDFDDILGDTTLRDELNKTDDGAWHYILLRCEKGMSDSEIATVIEDLNNKFAAAGVEAVARDWESAAGTFTSSVDSISSLFTVLIIILAIVVFIIIMNTMVISVLERTGEIGTMRAIGANKSFVRKLFFCESITLTLGAEIVGTILSLVVMGVLNLCNFSVSDDIAKMILGGGSISFIPTMGNFVSTMIIILVGTILANLYPVSPALKITPLKALSKGDA
jgi:putative ABC transport system permease protein